MPNTRDEDDDFRAPDESAAEEFGPYLVYERLGIGGMATVHRAKKRGIAGFERGVALKRILPHLSDDAEFIGSFVREAKLASLLIHPNIAQIYDFGRIGDVYFIAMEHVSGFDISQLLRHSHRHQALPPLGVVLSILCELCEALDYAHRFVDDSGQPLGIVHRDVSPSNLLVALTGHLKVIDFGIAKASPRPLHTDSGRVKGKLGYMSPEAVVGAPVSPASDVFSAGVVAHELLTIQPLFSAKTDHETVRRVREAEILPPSWRNPQVPAALDRIVLSALERDDRRRLQSAGEFRRALEEVAVEAGLRFSSGDVAAWWARGTSSDHHGRSHPPSAGILRSVAISGSLRPGTLSGIHPPSHAELSAARHHAPPSESRSDSADRHSGDRPSGLTGPKTPRAARASSRAPVVIALVGLCTIVAALVVYLFIARPVAAVAPAIPSSSIAASGSTVVRFIVRPADAIVEIGGKPVSGREVSLERGVYSVAVSHAGYKRWTSQIALHDPASQTVNVALEPAAASVRLSSQPAGLVAQLDGKPVDQLTPTEFQTSPGAHRLVVVGATGTWTQDFVAATDGTYEFRAVLPSGKRAASAAATSTVTRTTSPASERPVQRPSSGTTARIAAARDTITEPEERVDLDSEPFFGKPLAKSEPTPRSSAQPATPSTSPLTAPPRVAPSSRTPPLVPASTVTKLAGEIPVLPNGSGSADVYSKLCIGLDGHVTSVKIVKAGVGVTAELERSLLGWRYKPYVDDAGQPSPACFAVTFRLVFERAHRVSTSRQRSAWLPRPAVVRPEQHGASTDLSRESARPNQPSTTTDHQ